MRMDRLKSRLLRWRRLRSRWQIRLFLLIWMRIIRGDCLSIKVFLVVVMSRGNSLFWHSRTDSFMVPRAPFLRNIKPKSNKQAFAASLSFPSNRISSYQHHHHHHHHKIPPADLSPPNQKKLDMLPSFLPSFLPSSISSIDRFHLRHAIFTESN